MQYLIQKYHEALEKYYSALPDEIINGRSLEELLDTPLKQWGNPLIVALDKIGMEVALKHSNIVEVNKKRKTPTRATVFTQRVPITKVEGSGCGKCKRKKSTK